MVKKLSNQTERKDGEIRGNDLHHKLLTHGKRALTEIELSALVLNRRENRQFPTEKAAKIFDYCQNQLHEFSNLSVEDMMALDEMDEETCVRLLAVWELSNRRWTWVDQFPTIQNSTDAYRMFAAKLAQLTHEEFHVAYLNRANRVISQQCISIGGINATIVDMRIIFQKAILLKASTMIVAHNHPSGNLKPSAEDKELTKKLQQACKYFDIQFLDHLILSGSRYISFADEGLLIEEEGKGVKGSKAF